MAWAPGSDYVSRDGNVTFRDTGGQFAERVDEYGHGTGTYTNVNDLIPMSWLRPPEEAQRSNVGAGTAPVVRPPVAPIAPLARPAATPALAPPSGGGGIAAGWRGTPTAQATTPAWNTDWAMPPGNGTYSPPAQQRRTWDTDWALPPTVPSGYRAPSLTAPTIAPWERFNTRWATPPTRNTFDVQPYQPRPTYKQPVDTGSFTISITPGGWGGQ